MPPPQSRSARSPVRASHRSTRSVPALSRRARPWHRLGTLTPRTGRGACRALERLASAGCRRGSVSGSGAQRAFGI